MRTLLDDDAAVARVQSFAAAGARTGASAGSFAGPVGAGVGAGLGSATGYLLGVGLVGADPADRLDDPPADPDGGVTVPVTEVDDGPDEG